MMPNYKIGSSLKQDESDVESEEGTVYSRIKELD